jgi:hypothetical protein
MRSLGRHSCLVVLSLLLSAAACSNDEDKKQQSETKCTLGSAQGCEKSQVCEQVVGKDPACFDPIRIEGSVTNALDGTAVVGALVVARDANGAAVSGTAASDSAGKYSLVVPVPRDAEGKPVVESSYTLRADASQYQTFPTAPRVALPVKVDQPVAGVVSGAATNISLVPLPSGTVTGTISGKVQLEDPKGTLVVVGNATALATYDGSFTIFNVAPGSVTVSAYKQGSNLQPAIANVVANETTKGITLSAASQPTATVSGKVEIVDPGQGSNTSVILVVEDTFVENAAQGEAPPGLRASNVSGTFSIAGVPDGKYVVLAAFEDDYLVRDPDTCIAGTAVVRVTVAGADVALTEGFKITGALDVISPDKEQIVTGTPSFVWVDDASEDRYELRVYDGLGNLIWENTQVPSVNGGQTVTVPYGGPALIAGMVYQYRATSVRRACPLSSTEDLRGVFRYQ